MATESPRDTGTNKPVEQSGAPGEGDPALERDQPAAERPAQAPETTAEQEHPAGQQSDPAVAQQPQPPDGQQAQGTPEPTAVGDAGPAVVGDAGPAVVGHAGPAVVGPSPAPREPAAEPVEPAAERTAELPVVAPETAVSQTAPVAAHAQPAPAAVGGPPAQGSPAGSAERPANRSKRTEQLVPLPLDAPEWARARRSAAGAPPMVGVGPRRRRPRTGVLVATAAAIVALVAVAALAWPSLTGSDKTTTAPTGPGAGTAQAGATPGQTSGASQTSQAGVAAGTGAGTVQAVRQGFTQLPPEADGDAEVVYAVVLRNPRNDQVAVDVRAVLTFTGANGATVKLTDEGLDALLPGQTAAVADTTSAAGVTGLRVQILVGSWAPAQGLAGNLSADGVRTSVVAGKLTTTATLHSTLGQPLSGADVVAVYYDQAGRIIGGQADNVDVVPAGGAVPVLLDTSTTLAGVAKSEVYANPKDLLTPGG